MRKLKFLLLGLCMIFALIACEDSSDAATPVAATPDPIEVKSLAATLTDGDVYSVSHDGASVITSTGIMYSFNSDVSGTQKVYRNGSAADFIGFQGEGTGPVKFSMATTKDGLFKAAVEKTVKSQKTWKDADFTSMLPGRTYSGANSGDVTLTSVAATGQDTKYYYQASDKYQLVKIYSATQGWWKANDSAFSSITITKEGKEGTIAVITANANTPIFTGSPTTYTKADTSMAFLNVVKTKVATGTMGPTLKVTYTWDGDGKILGFSVGNLKYDFVESSNEKIGIYMGRATSGMGAGAQVVTLATSLDSDGDFSTLKFKFSN